MKYQNIEYSANGCKLVDFSNNLSTTHENNRNVYIIGAGVTGLSVGWQLAQKGANVQIFEASDYIGGMATTFVHEDFVLDLGPHKFFSIMDDRMNLARKLMGDEFISVEKRSRIRLSGHFINYPIGLFDVMKNLDPFIAVTGGISYLIQLVKNIFTKDPDRSYEDWLVRRFGYRLYSLIFAQYAEKIWGDPKTLTRELAETRVAIPGLLPLIWNMLFVRKPKGQVVHAQTFEYPKMGSGQFSAKLAQSFLENGGKMFYNSILTKVKIEHERVTEIQVGKEIIPLTPNDILISTLPLNYITKMISPHPSDSVNRAAKNLKTRDLILFYLLLDQPTVSNDNWLFFPEKKYIFNRGFEQKNFSKYTSPEDKTCFCVEIIASDAATWRAEDSDLYEKVIEGLEECGLVKREKVVRFFTKHLKWVYPVYDIEYKKNSHEVLDYLDGIKNLYSIGRQGGFNYIGQIDCLDIGIVTAEYIMEHKDNKYDWHLMRERFNNYIVLD